MRSIKGIQSLRPGAGMNLSRMPQKGAGLQGVIAGFLGVLSPGRGLFGNPEVVLTPLGACCLAFSCRVPSSRILGTLETAVCEGKTLNT